MVVFGVTIVDVAMPSAREALGFATTDQQWIITAGCCGIGCRARYPVVYLISCSIFGADVPMTEQSKVLITGATGTVGRQVVSQLLDTGTAVRALVRDPASADLPGSVELVRGHLSDPATLTVALDGVGGGTLIAADR